MDIYKDYIKTIETALSADKKTRSMYKGLSGLDGEPLNEHVKLSAITNKLAQKQVLPSLEVLAKQLNRSIDFNQRLGQHPDFAYLKDTESTEKHYIVSVFIDIKGSTNLFRKYDTEVVNVINDTIQKAAIHTCLVFGGYIHRLQGDGLFVYYGGKGQNKSDATLRALQSTSVFTYFVKNDLKNVFSQQGIDNIYTRIGIDLGHDKDVLWSKAGVGEICEITTCSLHTSLAAKMQAHAESNGIVIGQNVKQELVSLEGFFTPVCHRQNKENDKYIFVDSDGKFYYTQYDFHWLPFLKTQPFIATGLNGNLSLKGANGFSSQQSVNSLASIAVQSKPYFRL